jgi:hypothetical protein
MEALQKIDIERDDFHGDKEGIGQRRGRGILFKNDLPEENLQRFPGTAAQIHDR